MPRPHPIVIPQPLQRLRQPFDHPDWIFELKHAGFRALAYIDHHSCNLISRNGNVFGSFRDLDALLPGDILVRSVSRSP